MHGFTVTTFVFVNNASNERVVGPSCVDCGTSIRTFDYRIYSIYFSYVNGWSWQNCPFVCVGSYK